jgi:integrase
MARPKRDLPWVEWRDTGIAYACWYDDGKRRTFRQSLDTRDPKEAALRFGKFLVEGPKRAGSEGNAGLTVRQVLDAYVAEHVEQTDDKGRPYVADQERQKTIVGHLKAYFGDTPIAAIGPLESRAYAEVRRTGVVGGGKRRKVKNGSDSTIRRELNCLIAAANHAIFWKRMTAAQAPQVELPSEERGGEIKWFTKEQFAALVAAARDDEDLHDFIQLAYYTAARRRSIENLTKFQVDLKGGRINLMLPGVRATKKRKPIVPIYPEIRPIIERRMERAGERLFPDRDFYRTFSRLAKRALGVDEAWPHMLRHSRATHALMDGESIYKVAKLLGDTVATVERVYGHSDPEFLAMGRESA